MFCEEKVINAVREKENSERIVSQFYDGIAKDRNVNSKVFVYLSALAVELGHDELVYYLYEKQIKGKYKWKKPKGDDIHFLYSPLHVACRLGNEMWIRYFVGRNGVYLEDLGCGYIIDKPQDEDDTHMTAMEYLLKNDKPQLLEVVHRWYKPERHESHKGILHLCCNSKAFNCAKWCLEKNSQYLEARDKYGVPPSLHLLKLDFEHESFVKWMELFLSHGADPKVRGYLGRCCLLYAIRDAEAITKDSLENMAKKVKTILELGTSDQLTKDDYEDALDNCERIVTSSDRTDEIVDFPGHFAPLKDIFRLLLKWHGGHNLETEALFYDLIWLLKFRSMDHSLGVNDSILGRNLDEILFMIGLVEECAKIGSGTWGDFVYSSLSGIKPWDFTEEEVHLPRVTPLMNQLFCVLIKNGLNDFAYFFREDCSPIICAVKNLVVSVTPRSVIHENGMDVPVRSLREKCRFVVYHSLGGRPVGKVEKLEIPDILKQYLLFEIE